MVRAFPGDQDVHAVPSCLSLPCLQHLPSHHGFQQVPITHTHLKLEQDTVCRAHERETSTILRAISIPI